LTICITGVYCGILGLKATRTEEVKHALTYFLMLVSVGSTWVGYNYYNTYQISLRDAKREFDRNRGEEFVDNDDDSTYEGMDKGELVTNAMFASLFTLLVWMVCFYRAYVYVRDLGRRERERRRRIVEEVRERNEREGNAVI